MRVITPTGKLYEAYRVEPYVEVAFVINGMQNKLINVAKDMSVNPSGIKVFFKSDDNDFTDPFCYIGNLPLEKLQEIMESLLNCGYYDFSKLEYQKIPTNMPVTVDGGVSLPYFDELTFESFSHLNYIPREEDCYE